MEDKTDTLKQFQIKLNGENTRSDDDVMQDVVTVIGKKKQGKSVWIRDQIRILEKVHNQAWEGTGIKYRMFIHNPGQSRSWQEFLTVTEAYEQTPDKYIQLGEEYAREQGFKVVEGKSINVIFAMDEKGNFLWQQGGMQCQYQDDKDIHYMYAVVSKFYKDGATVWDDVETYMDSSMPSSLVKKYSYPIYLNRHFNWQVFYGFHGVTCVPTFLKGHVTKLVLFKNSKSDDMNEYNISQRFNNAKEIMKLIKKVEDLPPTDKWVQPHLEIELD